MADPAAQRAVLLAEHFDLKYPGPEPGELEFVLERIRDGGEPVLELGCGTGRMLVPLLERGIDATGIDHSPDMLDRCRAKCAAKGLKAELHVQSMQALDAGREFGTVFLGSCGLGVLTFEKDVRATFRGVRAHVRSRGAVSFEIETPPAQGSARNRPGIWSGGQEVAPDGSVLVNRQVYDYDPATCTRSGVMIFERYTDGRLGDTELHRTAMRFWDAATVTAWLQETGFTDVTASAAFAHDAPPGDAHWLVLRARRA